MTSDHYQVLGVSSEATSAQIEQAYREQVRRHHPDLCPDDPRARRVFQQIQTAFDTLHDPLRREAYELSRRPRPQSDHGLDGARPAGSPASREAQDELDSLRFLRRPGTALIEYRRRNRWDTLVDWLCDSDFLLPLLLVLPFLAIHATWLAVQMVRAVWQ